MEVFNDMSREVDRHACSRFSPAWRRWSKLTAIFKNKYLTYMLINISTRLYNFVLIITIIFFEKNRPFYAAIPGAPCRG